VGASGTPMALGINDRDSGSPVHLGEISQTTDVAKQLGQQVSESRGQTPGFVHMDDFGYVEAGNGLKTVVGTGEPTREFEEGSVQVPGVTQELADATGGTVAADGSVEIPEGAQSAEDIIKKMQDAITAQLARGLASKETLDFAVNALNDHCRRNGIPEHNVVDARDLVQLNAIRHLKGLPPVYRTKGMSEAAKEAGVRMVHGAGKRLGPTVHVSRKGSAPMRNPTKIAGIAAAKPQFMAMAKARGMSKKQAEAEFEKTAKQAWDQYQATSLARGPKADPKMLSSMLLKGFQQPAQ